MQRVVPKDTDTFCPARCVRINGTSPRPARGEVIFLASKIGWDGLVAAEEKDSMMNHAYGWMGGGMWIWTVIGVLIVVLLVVAINRVSTK